ncbi:MAG: acetate--CoA ligase [Firmicutes bacterium]|nr:acetate--CoA ligase [Bacillota bacterium]
MSTPSDDFTTLLNETRTFAPPQDFTRQANVNDPAVYENAKVDPEAYWMEEARRLEWIQPFSKGLEWDPPHAKWFADGTLNVASNCVDRYRTGSHKNKAALIWVGEPGDSKIYTYDMLGRQVDRAAHMLTRLGVKKGDRVTLYMPMIPELPIAMLACAKIGAIHSVVFGGFSADALRERIVDAGSSLVITADGGWRRGKVIPLKDNTDAAVENLPLVQKVLVVQRIGEAAHAVMHPGRDLDWEEEMAQSSTRPFPASEQNAEDVLFLLYTSGTTGKPKGIVHTTGGYLTGVANSLRTVFDLKEDDVYFCTADIGWITGHTYVLYGPLANGATSVMYEGSPDFPDRDRFWQIVEDYGVTIFYTAPTTIRTFMKWGPQYPARHDLSSLRLLATVGEPINPEAWMWYYEHIGQKRCPIADTWWQTETGCAMIAPLPGLTTLKPGSATIPIPGISAEVVDDNGQPVPPGNGGYLTLTKPWPSMLRTVWGDDARYQSTYWSRFPGRYFAGDGANIDSDNYFWILGRVDDVINVSGHRIGTMEVESALVDHPAVAESAVIGRAHPVKGQAISAFVSLKEGVEGSEALQAELKQHVVEKIGAIARPEDIYFTVELPKTRSGKIMRRLLRDIAERRTLGDTTTLADPSVVEDLKAQYHEAE